MPMALVPQDEHQQHEENSSTTGQTSNEET